jgi:hypothetical protein
MIDRPNVTGDSGADASLMDELLRTGLPEIKLALGEVIDRENLRPLPAKYARLLPETLLVVVLRGDAAEALRPVAPDIEREFTDSSNRHGSLYDRSYRVELQRTDDPDAPLYSVSIRAGKEDHEDRPPEPTADAQRPALPAADSDATRLEIEPPSSGWAPHLWMLIVESEGEAREAFRIMEPTVTVGRTASDPALRPTIAISNAPRVSRRQLVLRWQERDGAPGFRIYNLGLNAVHLSGREIPGARLRGDAVDIAAVAPEHTGWLPPGVPLRIGDEGPILRIEEVPPSPDEQVPMDPDATVFG